MNDCETRVLIVAEYVDEIRHLARQYGETMLRDPRTCVLAVEPSLQVYLQEQGIPYTTTCEFFDASSHQELASKSVDLLAIIRDGLQIRDELGVSSGYEHAFVFYTRFFLHHVMFLASVVHRACVSLKPERVIVADAGVPGHRGPDLTRDERYLARVARAVCREQDVSCETSRLPGRPGSALARRLRQAVKAAGARVLFSAADALLARRSHGWTLVIAPSKAHNLGRVLEDLRPMLGPRYLPVYLQSNDLPSLLKQFVLDTQEWSYPGLRVRPRAAAWHGFASALEEQLARLSARVDTSRQFFCCGVDLGPMVKERARTVLRPYLLELQAQTARLDRLLDTHRPDLIVSQLSAGWIANLGTLAARKSIPAMLIPHGSMVPSTDRHSLAEWREHGLGMTHTDYTYLAIQTPWTEAYLQQSPGASTAVRTGPLLFARTEQHGDRSDAGGRRPVEKTLVHVGTPKARDSMRFWTYETVDEYVRNINSLIRSVEQVDGCRLLVRFRSLEYLTEDDFKALLVPSDCYEICSKGSLPDYLGLSDLLVSYSSTAIEEALQLRIPVLQYDPQGKYCHVKARVLDPSMNPEVGSCYFVAREDHLTWALRWLMANHLSKPQPDSLWDEHRFEAAAGLQPFLETIGLVTAAERPAVKEGEQQMERPAWIRL